MRRGALALAALVVSGLLPTSIGEAQEKKPAPSAIVSPQAVAVAGVIQVTGVGWQPDSLVVVEVCGNRAAGGSLDCVAPGREADVDKDGTFRESLTATAPPKPCPCVVAVSAVPGRDRTLVPLEIEGAPKAPLDDQPAPAPRLVVDARLEGSGPWTAWFGASSQRTLVLTVRNTGTAPAGMRLAAAVGRGDTADVPIGVDDPGRLEPGASRTLRIPVPFDPLAFGGHIVAGEIAAPGAVAPFEVHTSIHPWGLYGAVLLGFVALAAVGFRRIRRRVRRSRVGDGPVSSDGWKDDRTDDEWAEADDEWTEADDEWAEADEEWAAEGEYATEDVDSEPAEIVLPDRPSPRSRVATGPPRDGVGDTPAAVGGHRSQTEIHWQASTVDQPNGADSG